MQSDSFEALLAWLSPEREAAGQAYERLRRKLIEFFDRRGCWPADELADEVLDRVGGKLAGGEVIRAENPATYCLGVARMVRKENLRSPERKGVQLENPDRHPAPSPDEARELERLHECLSGCLDRLSGEDRQLMQDYFHDDWKTQVERRKILARRLGLEPVSLRARVSRIVHDKLEACVRDCVERGGK